VIASAIAGRLLGKKAAITRSNAKDQQATYLEGLSPELKQKAPACKTAEDVLELAKQEGYELSDDQLEAVSGGMTWDCLNYCRRDTCPEEY